MIKRAVRLLFNCKTLTEIEVTPMSKNSCEVSQETSQVISLANAKLQIIPQISMNQDVKVIC